MENFGKNLKILREKLGLKQSQMIDFIGIKQSTWGGYETGKSFPNFSDLILIAEKFGISETDLIHKDLKIKSSLIEKTNEEKETKKGSLIGSLLPKTMKISNLGYPVYYFPYISGFLGALSGIKTGILTGLSSYSHPSLPPGLHIELPVPNSMMSPTIETGSKVVATLLSEPLNIISGTVYITIDNKQEVSCNRLYLEDNNTVLITSDNPKFPPFKRPLNDFETLFKVVEVRSTLLDPPLTDLQRKIADLERKIADLEGDSDEK